MATEPKDTTVDVENEDVVTVDITDNPDLAAAPEAPEPTVDVAPEPEPPKPERKRLAEPEPTLSAADEAAARLADSLKKNEEERKLREAAEATAQAERRAREAAEAERTRLQQQAYDAQAQAEQHQLTIITSGIENAQREMDSAEADLTRAYEAGEFAKAAKAQSRIGKAAADLSRLEEAKSNFEANAAQRRTAPHEGRVDVQPTGQTNSFEQFVTRFAPAAQAWLRGHPECVPAEVGGDARANARMMAGHYDALGKGLTPNTPEYFSVIEEHTGHRTPAEGVVPVAAHTRTAPVQRKAPVAAPVSREPPSPSTGVPRNTRQVTLSKEQQEAAKISFPHLEARQAFAAYARNLIELEQEGKMGRTTH